MTKTYKHRLHNALELVKKQAEDDGLWFQAQTAPEAYLQQELRRLHKVIEGQSEEYVLKKSSVPSSPNTGVKNEFTL